MPNKRKPKSAKVLEGTFRKDRTSFEPAFRELEGEPEKPDWLKGRASKIWERKVAKYKARGQAVAGFESMLAQYCALEAAIIDLYNKGIQPKASLVSVLQRLARDFFDTPEGNLTPEGNKPKNPFSNNGITGRK